MKLRNLSIILTMLISTVSTSAIAQKKNPSLLFFQHSDSGTLQLDKQAGCYQVHLNDAGKDVIYLSNSPDEVTGRLSVPVFMTSWQHQRVTQSAKPNAILHATLIASDNKKSQISDVFFIKSISVTHQGDNNSMTYLVCRFNNEAAFKVGKLQDINIFIDPFHRWPP